MMMMFEIGRFIINFGAIVAVQFTPDFTEGEKHAYVHLTGPVCLTLNEEEIAGLRSAFAAINQMQQSQIAVPVPPNLRGMGRN